MTQTTLISQSLARKMLGCIEEYERIKRKESSLFTTVGAFCAYHRFSRQNLLKIYRRYQQNSCESSLLPQRRGPRYKTRRTDLSIEKEVTRLRQLGNNRYEIFDILHSKKPLSTPSPSCIYNLCKKHGLNKLTQPQRSEKRKIIMERIGQLVHIDCHYLSKGITIEPYPRLCLVGIIDGYSRLAWAEIIQDTKALTVMFAVLKSLNLLKLRYGIEAEAALTDNGAEFGSGPTAKNKQNHPFERLLTEMGIVHRYTKPYRPQTNGKIERFWKTLNEDLLENACYLNLDDLKKELLEYLVYYNEHRPHQGIDGKKPKDLSPAFCNRIT